MKLNFRGENILNIPNILSLYRLIMFPFILVLALLGIERWFVILFCINLITDILDGFIARRFNLVTKFGAALDNLADMGTYVLAILGVFLFKWQDFKPHVWLLYLFLTIFIISYIVAFFRFGKIPGMHLYSPVIAGYLQGAFFFVLFVWGFNLWFYFVAVGWGVLAYIDKILVLLKTNDIKPGLKGIYWVMKEQK
ncbi:MAG: CDP-alcohol phosphatidyltransferase family protein [Mariniphaga sp.]|jgi:cardiolipin synthase